MSQPNRTGRLAGKVCGITGATGIAEAAAVRFAAEGARLFVVALREEDCVALADRIGASTEITWVAADLTNEEDTERAFARCAETFDRLDALLACAGGSGRPFGDGPLHSTSLESWNTTVALNLNTAFLSSREAVKIMLEQPTGGSVVYVSSVAATNPVAGAFNTLAYSAAKGGINSLTLNGACQYGAAGIRFNAILPALTVTPEVTPTSVSAVMLFVPEMIHRPDPFFTSAIAPASKSGVVLESTAASSLSPVFDPSSVIVRGRVLAPK